MTPTQTTTRNQCSCRHVHRPLAVGRTSYPKLSLTCHLIIKPPNVATHFSASLCCRMTRVSQQFAGSTCTQVSSSCSAKTWQRQPAYVAGRFSHQCIWAAGGHCLPWNGGSVYILFPETEQSGLRFRSECRRLRHICLCVQGRPATAIQNCNPHSYGEQLGPGDNRQCRAPDFDLSARLSVLGLPQR